MTVEQKIKVAIIGARSFTAGELVRIFLRHPYVEVTALQARVDDPIPFDDFFTAYRGADMPPITAVDVKAVPEGTDAVYLCLPHTVAAEYAGQFITRGVRVFDLSADFRYKDHKMYEEAYSVAHPNPELNAKAQYGLPELFRATLKGSTLVACPGCYPTAVGLALAPIMKRDMIVEDSVIADCKSGVSGAGKTPNERTHYCNANENFQPYAVATHRHQSEIAQILTRLAGEKRTLTFVPHLVPMERGILATVYAKLNEPIRASVLRDLYSKFYVDDPFVRVLPEGVLPATADVKYSNYCDIQVTVHEAERRLIVTAVIDNLVKGAAGQAVQCMNASYALPEGTGLM